MRKPSSLRNTLLVAAALSVVSLPAMADPSDDNERFGQMRHHGYMDAGDRTGSRWSDDDHDWRHRDSWRDRRWSRSDRDRDDDRNRSASRDDDDDDGDRRSDRRGDRMGRGMMGGMGPGSLFNVQVGDTRVTVRCGVRENASACVDAAVTLVNRLRESSTSSSSTDRPASPSTGSSSPSPSGPTSGTRSP
jgi:hypothetical protein